MLWVAGFDEISVVRPGRVNGGLYPLSLQYLLETIMQVRSLVCLIVVLSIACAAGSFTIAQQATGSDSGAALNELLTKRRDTLKERADVLEQMYTDGSVSLTTILAGRDQLLDAELQLVKTKEQRLTLYQKRLDNMRALEDTVKKRYEAGQSTLESKLSATAARLQAEIDPLREQL